MSKCSVLVFCVLLTYAAAAGSVKTVITFNTGLLEQTGAEALGQEVPRAARRDAIIEQLNETTADVTCLQEVFVAEDVHLIVEALESIYPYSYSVVHDKNGNVALNGFSLTPACSSATFAPFAACLQTNCNSATPQDALVACLLSNCILQFVDLSDECVACFRTSALDFTRCTNPEPAPGFYRRMNIPGLLLLSRRPMKGTRHVDLHPGSREIIERGYLEAKVEGIGRVACAHTTNYGSPVYFEFDLQTKSGISSFVEQGTDEINKLVDQFSDEHRVIVAGDFNVGPAIPPNVSAVQQHIFGLLAGAFCDNILPQCTFCMTPENLYNLGVSRSIDHIFYKGYKSLGTMRIFDDPTSVGGNVPSSDHFGVKQFLKCTRCRHC